jgi:hypothetical protein
MIDSKGRVFSCFAAARTGNGSARKEKAGASSPTSNGVIYEAKYISE